MFGIRMFHHGHGCKGWHYGMPWGTDFYQLFDELEALKLYRERLELRAKEIEAEIKAVQRRIDDLSGKAK